MNGYYSKRLQKNSKRYSELQENIRLYFEHSIEKEQKQKSYLEHHNFINYKSGEVLNINYDFEKKYKEYSKVTEQRALTIQELAKRNENMCSVFITLTLPSAYHPFKSIKTLKGRLYVEDNPDFMFDSLKEAVSYGYKELNRIYQTFYKRLKNYVKSDLYYIKAIENHVTMIPHCHLVLYFPLEHLDRVKGLFKRVVEHFKLNRTDIEEVSFKEDINYASKYLLKYIIKDLNNSSDIYKARVLDGWKRFHKIRVLTSSQLPLNVMVYKQIYKAISFIPENKINSKSDDKISVLKEKINEEVQSLNIPLYLYFQDNFSIQKTTIVQGNRRVSRQGKRDSIIKVKLTTEKKAKYYKIREFEVSYKNKKIYTKQQFTKIQI
ncbi:hypothetical protein [Malaciobacter canalis]|uniref:hypothetical protein n=1 Tax=Malaciobacter canalis TaxID=1912871 RepID=UPI00384CC96D